MSLADGPAATHKGLPYGTMQPRRGAAWWVKPTVEIIEAWDMPLHFMSPKPLGLAVALAGERLTMIPSTPNRTAQKISSKFTYADYVTWPDDERWELIEA